MRTEERCNYRIIKLAYACPLYIKNPHCPLKEVRTREFNDKLTWFSSLSVLTKQTIHDYHLQCYLKHRRQKEEICPGEGEPSAEGRTLAPASSKDLSLFKGTPERLCKVKEYLFDLLLCGESCRQGECRHQYTIGGKTFCSSPVRKEIYKKYQL